MCSWTGAFSKPTERSTGPLGAGCIYSAQYYQQKGRYDRNPKVGDQVFFQSGGEIGHTGIVVEVTDSTIVTVEGNSSDQVKKNTYNRSSSYIAGYGHPLYGESKNAQILLIDKGYYCGGPLRAGRETADGEFGPTTEKSVKGFQTKRNLTADGIIGSDTWKALLTA